MQVVEKVTTKPHCDFCGKERDRAVMGKVHMGSLRVMICLGCAEKAAELLQPARK